jgi:hypothetical protein
MKMTMKTWTALGAALATTTAAIAHAGPAPKQTVMAKSPLMLVAEESGEGGESEGGEAKSAGNADYLANLGYVIGHLIAGTELYALGDAEQAKTHMKHPQDEIYADLEPAFMERKAPGFATELAALAAAVEGGEPADAVRRKLDAVIAAVDKNGTPANARERADTIVKLVRTAGEEYAIGVKDGKIVEAHEYQDAYGFVQAAKRLLDGASEAEKKEYAKPFGEIAKHLAELDKAWPDLAGKKPVETDASVLAGVAARMELAALGIK